MIDVVFVTWNAREQALNCIAHLDDPGVVASITAIDNGSSDGTAEAVRETHPGVNVVALQSTIGLAAGLNRGAELGKAPYVLFLNDDVFAVPGSIAALLEALQDRPDAVAAGGRLVDDDLRTQPQYGPRAFPSAATLVARLVGIERLWTSKSLRAGRLRGLDDGHATVAVDQPAGACLLVRRSIVERVGGWDERYWFWYEDVDFARRLSAHGRSLYVPTAPFRHVGGATAKRITRAEGHRNVLHGMLQYASTYCSAGGRVAVALTVAVTSVARGVLRLRSDVPGARLYAATAREAIATLLSSQARR